MAIPKPNQKLINTTGKAIVATLRNNIVSSESLIDFPKGNTIEQVGNPIEFAGFLYIKDATGKAYRSEDFTYLLEEVNLKPKQETGGNSSIIWWAIGGFLLFNMLKK